MTSQKWNHVEMIHFFEHLFLWEARDLLKQIHSILDVDGSVAIEVPNLQYAAEVIAGIRVPPKDHPRFSMWPLYGDPSRKDESYGHHWGYTPKSIVEELEKAGFSRWQFGRATAHGQPERDMRVLAWKN